MKQRLAIASALLNDPEILILDEPTNGLDPAGIAEIRELIKQLNRQGKTIIMASHILDEVEKVCTHVAIIQKGDLKAVGSVKEILDTKALDETVIELAADDLDTLQAVIANRYDVMATYAKSIKRAWRDEFQVLKDKRQLEADFLKSSKKLLQREPAKLEAPQQQQLRELFAHSKALKTMHDMRVELGAIWERSHANRDQLLQQLQDWCVRAETSGIAALREFSLRLRSYA